MTHVGTHVIKLGGKFVWRIAGLIVAVVLIVLASGIIGGLAGHWAK
jgi:hypothetical protein